MKIKKEYIIAAVIIAASVLYLLLRDDSKVNYEIPVLGEVDKEAVIAVEFTGEEGSVSLRKEGETWKISPQGYRASASEVNRLLTELSALSIADLISPREDYGRYELDDDKAVYVTMSTIEGTAREFYTGKISSTSIYTYVRLKDRKGVYSVRGNLQSLLSFSMDKWRDRQVLNFNPDEAAALQLVKSAETVLLTKTAVTETPGWSRDGEAMEDPTAMDNHMKTLGMLNTIGYIDDEIDGEAQAVVTITTASGVHTLSIFDKQEKGYAATSSYVDGTFLIPFYVGDMILDL